MQYDKENLVVIDTNSADDSRGVAFGLTGNLYMPVVVGALISVAMLTALLWQHSMSLPMTFAVSCMPFAITLMVIKTFFQDKPPHFASDMFEAKVGNNCFSRHPYGQPKHPIKRAQS